MHKLCKAILDDADSRPAAQRFIFLFQMYASLRMPGSRLINFETGEDGTNIVMSWLAEYLPTLPVPPDYFITAAEDTLNNIHPMMRESARAQMIQKLALLSKEEARKQLVLDFSDNQFEEVYQQVQYWLALNSTSPSRCLN